jgi:hypothetical protein
MMKKNYFIVFILIVILVAMTGCGNENKETSNQNGDQQTETNRVFRTNENFAEASLDDLEIGQQVLAMAVENSDGSLTAENLIIGGESQDWQMAFGPMQPRSGMPGEDGQTSPDFSAGERPNFEELQNMSEEERTQFMENMRAERQQAGANLSGRRGGNMITRLAGEIIDMDDKSVTLKLEEGGSKLVFYSDKTVVLKPKEQND